MILSRQGWDQILGRSSEDAHGWGQFRGRVWGVPVLEDGFLECININFTIFPHIARNQPLDGFDTYFSSAVAVRECHGTKAMVDPPIVQKLK